MTGLKMADNLYAPNRRQFLITGGLTTAGTLVPTSLSALVQLTEPQYKIKFQLLDDRDVELWKHNIVHPYYEPKSVPFTKTAEEIRTITQGWQARGLIPDLSQLDSSLENLARQLDADPNFFHRTFELSDLKTRTEGNMVFIMGYKAPLNNIPNSIRIVITGIQNGDHSIGPTTLMQYSITQPYHVDQRANYMRMGDLTREAWDLIPGEGKGSYKGVMLVPQDAEDKSTITMVDATGIRGKLLKGLRNQNLKFDNGWQPIIPK